MNIGDVKEVGDRKIVTEPRKEPIPAKPERVKEKV